MLNSHLVVPACIVLAAAGSVLAQSTAPEDVLRGPRVQQQRAPGTEQPFAESTRRAAGGEQALIRGIRSLFAEDAPAEVRPTPEQMREIREIFSGMRRGGADRGANRGADAPDAMREATPRRSRTAPPEASRRPDARGDAPDARRSAERRQRSETFAANASKAWRVLTREQQDYIRGQMDRAPEARWDGASRGTGPTWADEMPESLKRRLASMSPEERRAVWSGLDGMLSARDGARRQRGGAEGRSDRRSRERGRSPMDQ